MKKLLLLFLVTISVSAYSQTSEKNLIEQAAMNYIEGFYFGDSVKLQKSLSPQLFKYGYWKGKSGQYEGEAMTFAEAIAYAKKVFDKKSFPKEGAPKEVTVLDQQEFVACAKVIAWWGVDYLLLSKKDGVWKIEQVLWQGPLATITRG